MQHLLNLNMGDESLITPHLLEFFDSFTHFEELFPARFHDAP
jgi:hypothetical protein